MKYDNPNILLVDLQPTTQEDADAIRSAHKPVELDWIPIEDFPMDEKGTTLVPLP